MEESIQEIKVKHCQWLEEFKTIDYNEEKWKSIDVDCKKIITDLEAKAIVLKQDLLLNKLKEYQLKPIEFGEIDINSAKYSIQLF